MSTFPWRIARPLGKAQRARVAKRLTDLLRWQRHLDQWPSGGRGYPIGTPFVSIYAGGRLTGCFGSDEGSASERLNRAFLRALEDQRFGSVSKAERAALCAQVSYPVRVHPVDARDAVAAMEVGVHGVALSRPNGPPVVLLPQVARDGGLGPLGMLETAAQKAGLDRHAWRDASITLFETDDVVSHASGKAEDARTRAVRWLTRLIADDGTVTFAIDGRSRQVHQIGPMHHGRAAVVIGALATFAPETRRMQALIERALLRLARDLRDGIAGKRIEGFPDHPAVVAGSLALACLAGAGLERELSDWVSSRPEVHQNPWHCGQVALALRGEAPRALWRVAVKDLERSSWAPWTLLAARARNELAIVTRCERAVIDSIRSSGPHEGGANVTAVPELALTALVAESLAASRSRAAQRAVLRARSFLLKWQHGAPIRAALEPELVDGAFPASPIADLARGDVTGHALMALGAS